MCNEIINKNSYTSNARPAVIYRECGSSVGKERDSRDGCHKFDSRPAASFATGWDWDKSHGFSDLTLCDNTYKLLTASLGAYICFTTFDWRFSSSVGERCRTVTLAILSLRAIRIIIICATHRFDNTNNI